MNPKPPSDQSLYERLGAEMGHRLSAAFYSRVSRDPVLGPLFPGSLKCPIRHLGWFLDQFFGGPNEYSAHRFFPNLRSAHARFRIGTAERDAWLHQMGAAMDEVGIVEPERSALLRYFEVSSAYLINSGDVLAAEPEWDRGCPVHREVAEGWEEQHAVEELFRAIEAGDGQAVNSGLESALVVRTVSRDPDTLMELLAALGNWGASAARDYVWRRLEAEPLLLHRRYGGGATLLHDAAFAWSVSFTQLLLDRGADPNIADGAGHTPLYYAANRTWEGNEILGVSVVRLLLEAGAQVNACEGVKRCTALHMAARRGNVRIAEALLEGGANLEARDSLGETPLRRAVNCGKPEVAALLLRRGADPHSIGSKGLTPIQAARGAAMKSLFALEGAR